MARLTEERINSTAAKIRALEEKYGEAWMADELLTELDAVRRDLDEAVEEKREQIDKYRRWADEAHTARAKAQDDLERVSKERDEAIKKLACVEFTDWEKVSELNKKLQNSYRCFHCGEYFPDGEGAAEHFGPKGSVVACVLDEIARLKSRLADQDEKAGKAGKVFEDYEEEIAGLKTKLASRHSFTPEDLVRMLQKWDDSAHRYHRQPMGRMDFLRDFLANRKENKDAKS